jgi:hypothetical protein
MEKHPNPDPRIQASLKEGSPCIGMCENEVISIWESPSGIDRTETARGTLEVWTYERWKLQWHLGSRFPREKWPNETNHLVFADGILVSIHSF